MFPADEHPFLAAIAARPAEDVPRLVYADYLDETGLPSDAARAELIRVQIALARLSTNDSRRTVLVDRESELLDSHRLNWTAPLARLGARFQFRRGLPDAVVLDAALFLDRGEELFDNTPAGPGRSFVVRLRLNDAARSLRVLAACPLLKHVAELDLSDGDLGNGGVAALLASAHLRNIRVLELGQNRLDNAGAAAIAAAGTLPKLESLSLCDNDVGPDGSIALAESPFLAGLLELDLIGNEVDDVGLLALVNGPATRRMTRFRIADNPLRDGVVRFASSELFTRVAATSASLDLHRCGIEPAGAAALAASPAIRGIEHLDLDENYLGDAGAVSISTASNLRVVKLVRNQITDAGAAALLNLPNLQYLDVSNNRLTKRGVESLKAAANERDFTLVALHNGTETMIALPAPPAAQSEIEQVAHLKRGLAHPARPG
jgi:uncharacterized protein (TIGR02996 family)